uniref:Uncharacterized protein n=1 Tax=Anguilla anguilla TaxID=7936 RepID=A0A0E9R854_ANGAN
MPIIDYGAVIHLVS